MAAAAAVALRARDKSGRWSFMILDCCCQSNESVIAIVVCAFLLYKIARFEFRHSFTTNGMSD
jgi:hypothetical protein